MPALQRDGSNSLGSVRVADAFHVYSVFGQRMFFECAFKLFGFGVRHGTGDFARSAGKALFYNAINTFHNYFLKWYARISVGLKN